MLRILLLLMAFGVFAAVIATSGGSVFVNAPSIVILVIPSFLLAAGYHGAGALGAAISAADGESTPSAREALKHQQVLQSLRSLICACGGLAFLIGLVQMLQNMSDPTKIGPAMGVAMLAGVYALFLSEMLVAPLAARLRMEAIPAAPATPAAPAAPAAPTED